MGREIVIEAGVITTAPPLPIKSQINQMYCRWSRTKTTNAIRMHACFNFLLLKLNCEEKCMAEARSSSFRNGKKYVSAWILGVERACQVLDYSDKLFCVNLFGGGLSSIILHTLTQHSHHHKHCTHTLKHTHTSVSLRLQIFVEMCACVWARYIAWLIWSQLLRLFYWHLVLLMMYIIISICNINVYNVCQTLIYIYIYIIHWWIQHADRVNGHSFIYNNLSNESILVDNSNRKYYCYVYTRTYFMIHRKSLTDPLPK